MPSPLALPLAEQAGASATRWVAQERDWACRVPAPRWGSVLPSGEMSPWPSSKELPRRPMPANPALAYSAGYRSVVVRILDRVSLLPSAPQKAKPLRPLEPPTLPASLLPLRRV